MMCHQREKTCVCGAQLETTSRGEEVFAFIAAAAGTEYDGHQLEVVVHETEESVTQKQRSHSVSQRTGPYVSKKEFELLTYTEETLVRALRRKEAKPLILHLARDFVYPSCQEIQNQRPHPVASLEAIPPKWQNNSLMHTFSVIVDEGCQDAFLHE